MGGIDALDSMMGLYRIHVRSKKYYLHLFFHFLDMCIVNYWLLYRRASNQMSTPTTSKRLPLADFKAAVAEGLCKVRKSQNPGRRPASGRPQNDELRVKKRRLRVQPLPLDDVRFDGMEHWPEVTDKRMRCRVMRCKSQSHTRCTKCGVYLCLSKQKNCFADYHKM